MDVQVHSHEIFCDAIKCHTLGHKMSICLTFVDESQPEVRKEFLACYYNTLIVILSRHIVMPKHHL